MNHALRLCATLLPLATSVLSCAAVYPELTTPVRVPLAAQQIDPPPPADLYWISIREGTAPERTRDGRTWQELGGKLPDPFVMLFVNGAELLRTNPESNTLHPTWPGSPRGNFHIQRTDKLRVEMWQEALVKTPICVKNIGGEMEDWTAAKQIRVTCDGGSEIIIAWEPAHGRTGYGFYYELRTETVNVTRVFEQSPAARAGIRTGDQLVTVNDMPVKGMKTGDLQGHFNAPRPEGVEIEILHSDGVSAKISLKEGAIYPLFSEVGSIP